MAMDDIKNRFVGKWKLHRSENFEDFLGECGKLCNPLYCPLLIHFRFH